MKQQQFILNSNDAKIFGQRNHNVENTRKFDIETHYAHLTQANLNTSLLLKLLHHGWLWVIEEGGVHDDLRKAAYQ